MSTLADFCNISITLTDADFWVIAKGDEIGKPIEQKVPNSIGVKVIRTDLLLPKYLFYVIQHLHMRGSFKGMAKLTANDLLTMQVQS